MAGSTARVLVVDDEEANRDMLSRRLERNGFAVEAVESGAEALSSVEDGDYDVVLLDSMMPGMTGIEVLRLLRAVRSAEELPVIMVTAVTESAKVAEALDLGANDYVTKPIDFPVALARIRSQLSRKQADEALRASEQRYALAARGANDGLWDWEIGAGKVYYSPRWKAMLGYAEQELSDSPAEWLSRVHERDREGLRAAIEAHLAGRTVAFEHEYRVRHRDGTCRWMLGRGLASRNGRGEAVRFAGSQTDITAGKTVDPLTALASRVAFNERVAAGLGRLRRDPDYFFGVLFLDLDRFKLINDTFGHAAGDQLLVEVAGRLREWLPEDGGRGGGAGGRDVVGRLGGDEFVVYLEGIGDRMAGEAAAERILNLFRPAFQIEGRSVFCTASIGVALAAYTYRTPDELIRDADTAMYTAKAAGKARWAVFDKSMRDRVTARLAIENDLRWAIERGQFVVYYQPRVNMAEKRICGFEALVRWQHPERGLISPAEFIPVAEETGMIHEIGLFVLREACRQMKEWQDRYHFDRSMEIGVNLSPRQCLEPGLVSQVAEVLEWSGLDPGMLQLELTESSLLENLDQAREVFSRLKSLGVGLKIDDFGTGYSCLRYLSELPFDALKIDRSFTGHLTDDPDAGELVKTILSLAGNLKMEVVAEGVENREQEAALQAAGCEYGQGFYYSRPVGAAAAEELLRASLKAGSAEPRAEAPSGPEASQ